MKQHITYNGWFLERWPNIFEGFRSTKLRRFLLFQFRKSKEVFLIQQNIRNGHINIQIMKEHVAYRAYFWSQGQKLIVWHYGTKFPWFFVHYLVQDGGKTFINTAKCSYVFKGHIWYELPSKIFLTCLCDEALQSQTPSHEHIIWWVFAALTPHPTLITLIWRASSH